MFLIYSTESVCTTGNDINEYAHEREKKNHDCWMSDAIVMLCSNVLFDLLPLMQKTVQKIISNEINIQNYLTSFSFIYLSLLEILS